MDYLSSLGGDFEKQLESGPKSHPHPHYFLGKASHLLDTIPKNLPLGERAVTQQQNHVRVAAEAIQLVPG